ncbi:MAG: hypothetical protein GX985_00935 [Gallicola sp.]|uniref:permease prefix domain 1-containing protein n=1 Tax=Gallicola sp. Sow4_E12 TaxID=3438785 RepID=UPI0017F34D32|nr:hypothetical protein [Gallicola sp.]
MDTIRAFIEGLFAQYEDSPDIRQAKKELYQMMEDKYLDLKAQGKSENEAVGEVIAGIGTLEELEEDLNFRAKDQVLKNNINLTDHQVEEFLEDRKDFARKISFGVAVAIMSAVPLIFLQGMRFISEDLSSAIGVGLLIIMIAFAVSIFIPQGMKISKYSEFEFKDIEMTTQKKLQVEKEEERYQDIYRRKLSIGIPLCVVAVLPVIFISILFEEQETLLLTAVCFLLIVIAIGVKMIVEGSILNDSYSILLQKGDYRNKKINTLLDSIGGVYWTLAAVIYLLWSFLTWDWHITWMVWPIAGVMYGLISAIVSLMMDNRN